MSRRSPSTPGSTGYTSRCDREKAKVTRVACEASKYLVNIAEKVCFDDGQALEVDAVDHSAACHVATAEPI